MIVDAHTHIGHKTLVATPADLVKSMDKAGIDKSMVFAGRMWEQATEILLDEIAPFGDRLYAVGSVSPLDDVPNLNDEKIVERVHKVREWLKAGTIRGLKFYPGYEHFYPYDDRVCAYLRVLEQTGYPAIFHSGDTFSAVGKAKLKYAHPLHIDEVAVDYPDLKIVIAHMGYPWHNDAAEVVYKNRNVYADCSGFVYGAFEAEKRDHFYEVVRHFVKVADSHDKLIFGTDWPICEQSSYLLVVRALFEEDEWVLSKTAKSLFKL